MEPKRKEPGGCPPTDEQKTFSVHTALLKGIAAVFRSTAFFLFPGPCRLSGKSQQTSACAERCARFSFVGKCRFLLFPGRTGQLHCRGAAVRPGFLLEIQTERRYSVDAGKKENMGSRPICRGRRMRYMPHICGATGKMRYFEADLKNERPVYGSNGEIKRVLPSREIPLTGSWKKTPASLQPMRRAWRM